MARQPRVYIEGVLYYVTSRSGHSYNLFMDDLDYREYLGLIDKYKSQYGFKLFSYALLPAHIHLLIELKNKIGISSIMHDITSLYTKSYNSRYSKKGHLFQERFNATLAEKDTYLLPLVRHIHLNPKREGLISDPASYPYSSHQQYLDPAKRTRPEMRSEVEEAFQRLGGREREFAGYVANAKAEDVTDLKKAIRKNRILGPKDFIERMKRIITDEQAKREEAKRKAARRSIFSLLVAGIAAMALVVIIVYFQAQTSRLATEYGKTLSLYRRTLDVLQRERNIAASEKKDIEDYAWKIRLTEEAITKLEEDETRRVRELKELEGYAWRIRLTPIGAAAGSGNDDIIFFKNHQVSSNNLVGEGFPVSNYSRKEGKGGVITWETMQTNAGGDTANWRGDWDGRTMKGILRRHSFAGAIRDYSFTSTGERIKETAKNVQKEKVGGQDE